MKIFFALTQHQAVLSAPPKWLRLLTTLLTALVATWMFSGAPAQAASSCPNEQLRAENNSQSLPECRAYELVSNGDSGGVGVATNGVLALNDAGQVLFGAQVFGNPPSLPGLESVQLAERGGDGWSVVSMNPGPAEAFATPSGNYAGSADLSKVLWGRAEPGQMARAELRWTVRASDGSLGLASPLIAPLLGGEGNSASVYGFLGGSADLATFVFGGIRGTKPYSLLPGEPLLTGQNLYEVSDADTSAPTLRLVNADNADAQIGGPTGATLGGGPVASHAISEDGSIIYFSAETDGGTRVFKRVDGDHTITVSESQCDRGAPEPPCSDASGDDLYQGASANGSVAVFTSARQLTDSDTDDTPDLYVYDSSPPVGQPDLVQASAGEVTTSHPVTGDGAEVEGVVAASTDGSRIYFVAKGELTESSNAIGQKAEAGADNLYLFEQTATRPAGRVAFVTDLGASDSDLWSVASSSRKAYALPIAAGAEGNGHFLVFSSNARLTSEDQNLAADVYRYDAADGRLLCLSCEGHTGAEPIEIAPQSRDHSQADYVAESRAATEDGSRAVFITKEPLLPADTNTAYDAYEWSEGKGLSLLTGAAGASGLSLAGHQLAREPTFVKISPDGEMVVFSTEAPLIAADHNSVSDLYVARVDGGYPQPPPPAPCATAEACMGPAPPAAPSPFTAQSATVVGPTNPPVPKPRQRAKHRCGKGSVRRQGRCVKRRRHHRRHAHHHKRSSTHRPHGVSGTGGIK